MWHVLCECVSQYIDLNVCVCVFGSVSGVCVARLLLDMSGRILSQS